MIKLGFVSAILAEQTLEQVVSFAGQTGYSCVEIMCWPAGKAERRYAGITHIDVGDLSKKKIDDIHGLLEQKGVAISGLGYYPNPLEADKKNAGRYVAHLKKVIDAANKLGIKNVNTFIGRDHSANIEDNFKRFKKIWPPIVRHADKRKIKIGIENCPMFFTNDEWPGGKNLAISPAIWRRMFKEIPSASFGLNYDPSHLVWQFMDYIKPIYRFGNRIFHVHLKDATVMRDQLNDVGILATPLSFHRPKLPGLGDVDWGKFFSALNDVGYKGAACVEVEDRSYEGSLKIRKKSLVQSREYLEAIPTSVGYPAMRELRDKVRQFLKDNGAYHEDIDMDKFCDIFRGEMQAGLAGSDSSLAMIPTYIEVGREIPPDKRVIVLDAGGTNFRVATVHFDQSGKPVIENFMQKPMPGLDREVGKKEFFATVADYMAGVADTGESIGFCFSYPTEILPNRDGRLIRFCKEVKARQVEGELIGQSLVAALIAAGHKGNKRVAILNDTVATLLAGMATSGDRAFDSYIGFIPGTGSNCCYIESNRKITKAPALDPAGKMIVNVESGSFGRAPRGAIDLLLDESTLDPGSYTFEKMFSGGYFGSLCLKALQHASSQGLLSGIAAEQLPAAVDLETKDVNSFLRYPQGDNPLAAICAEATVQDRGAVWYVLDGLIERAARVVAAMLSSVVLETDKGHDPCEPVCITAEGTTFYELKSLRERVEGYLRSFLQDKHGRFVEFVHVEDATLIGAAIAGLTN